MSVYSQKAIQRFWSHVETRGDCWVWDSPLADGSRGTFHVASGEQKRPYLVAWDLVKGPRPSLVHLVPLCDTHLCVNPAHWAEPIREPEKVGYCRCGCGGHTRVSDRTVGRWGWVKGEPLPYLPSHRVKPDAMKYTVEDRGFDSPCWLACGRLDAQGYRLFRYGGKKWRAHVYFYEQRNGPVPTGKQVHHRCEQKSCVNPDHLEALTPAEHSARHAGKRRREFCRNGHRATVENSMKGIDGFTRCRICAREKYRRYQRRRRQRSTA